MYLGGLCIPPDALSGAFGEKKEDCITGEAEVEVYVNSVLLNLQVSDEKLKQIKKETEDDQQLTLLKECIMSGFPKNKLDCPAEIREFWNIRDELSFVKGLLLKGLKVIIPKSLRKEMLKKIHQGHLGIEKCRRRACEVLYWPGLNQAISEIVQSCATCQEYRPKQASEPLHPHPVTSNPWEKIGVDLCQFEQDHYLVMCDYYSNYPVVCKPSSTSSEAVINAMKFVFSSFGICKECFSDNGPQFRSKEFKMFSIEYDFKHITSSAKFPRSNGLVESCVKIVKNLLKKSKNDGSDFNLNQ